MSYTNQIILCSLMLACCIFFMVIPAHAFTANSLDITIDKNGDAIATFRFTLEGILENSIPQSMLEEELKKGLTTSSEPPELKSMDKSSAVLLMKKFADISDEPTGRGYLTASMDFKKAEIALQNSALSSAVSADFSPATISLTFPDSYKREFSNVDVLPAVFHIVVDTAKTPRVTPTNGAGALPGVPAASATRGSMNVTSTPQNVKVYLDSDYIGDAPAVFPEIAPGVHSVEFRKDDFQPQRKNVTIIAGKTTNVLVVLTYVPPPLAEDTSSFPMLPLLVVIIGVIAIAIGGYCYWSEKTEREWGEEEDTEEEKSPARGPVAKMPEIRDPVGKDPAAEDSIIRDPVGKDPAVRNTVVKVTMLKDIPDKTTGDHASKDTRK